MKRIITAILAELRAQWSGTDANRHDRRKRQALSGRKNTRGQFHGGACYTKGQLKASKFERYAAGKAGK
jgi:hypothetical protein